MSGLWDEWDALKPGTVFIVRRRGGCYIKLEPDDHVPHDIVNVYDGRCGSVSELVNSDSPLHDQIVIRELIHRHPE